MTNIVCRIEYVARPMSTSPENDGVGSFELDFEPWRSSLETVANLKRYNTVFRNARKIYHLRLRQGSLTPEEHVEVKRLAEELKTILMDIDNSVPGSHTPLWPYFVGGAESSNQIERSFFYARLERLWNMTGSRNP